MRAAVLMGSCVLATLAAGVLLFFSGWPAHLIGYLLVSALALTLMAFHRRLIQQRLQEFGEAPHLAVAATAHVLTVAAVVIAMVHAWLLASTWSR